MANRIASIIEDGEHMLSGPMLSRMQEDPIRFLALHPDLMKLLTCRLFPFFRCDEPYNKAPGKDMFTRLMSLTTMLRRTHTSHPLVAFLDIPHVHQGPHVYFVEAVVNLLKTTRTHVPVTLANPPHGKTLCVCRASYMSTSGDGHAFALIVDHAKRNIILLDPYGSGRRMGNTERVHKTQMVNDIKSSMTNGHMYTCGSCCTGLNIQEFESHARHSIAGLDTLGWCVALTNLIIHILLSDTAAPSWVHNPTPEAIGNALKPHFRSIDWIYRNMDAVLAPAVKRSLEAKSPQIIAEVIAWLAFGGGEADTSPQTVPSHAVDSKLLTTQRRMENVDSLKDFHFGRESALASYNYAADNTGFGRMHLDNINIYHHDPYTPSKHRPTRIVAPGFLRVPKDNVVVQNFVNGVMEKALKAATRKRAHIADLENIQLRQQEEVKRLKQYGQHPMIINEELMKMAHDHKIEIERKQLEFEIDSQSEMSSAASLDTDEQQSSDEIVVVSKKKSGDDRLSFAKARFR